jgi:hypothetical protein
MKKAPCIFIFAIFMPAGMIHQETRPVPRVEPSASALLSPANEQPGHSQNDIAEPVPSPDAARLETFKTFLDELHANPKARPHLEAVLNYLRTAPPEMFSVQNLPSDRNGLTVLDGNSSIHMIKDESIRAHWQILLEIMERSGDHD